MRPLFPSQSVYSRFHRKQEQADIPEIYSLAFFKYFKKSDKMQMALFEYAKAFVLEEEVKYNFILAGGTGTGKTYTACTILNEIILRYPEMDVLFAFSLNMFDKIRRSYSTNDESYYRKLISIDLLCIDDLSYEFSADETKNLCRVLTERHNRGLGTILTTNRQNIDFLPNSIRDRVLTEIKGKYSLNLGQRTSYRDQSPLPIDDCDVDVNVMEKMWEGAEQENNETGPVEPEFIFLPTYDKFDFVNYQPPVILDPRGLPFKIDSKEYEKALLDQWRQEYLTNLEDYMNRGISFVVFMGKRSEAFAKILIANKKELRHEEI